MNCHYARQLISPYLDGQLTGQEMLALGDHLAGCESCQDEMSSLRQIKTLLRGLHTPAPRLEFSRQLSSHEILSGNVSWKPTPPPQRGRRLVSALALSCLTLLALAPASREGQVTASVSPLAAFPSPSRLSSASGLMLPAPAALGPEYQFVGPPRRTFVVFSGTDISGHAFSYAQPYSEQPYEPPLTAFQPGTATLTSYHPR